MPPTRRAAILYCTAALLLYATIALTAARGKSPTYDEPLHALSAYGQLHDHDFTLTTDQPPLWSCWAALPLLAGPPPRPAPSSPAYHPAPLDPGFQMQWAAYTFYDTPNSDPDSVIARTRVMMVLVAVALGAALATLAGLLAGPLAACVAVTLYALDPNFLAHGPLLKNDVAIALCFTCVSIALWHTSRRLTFANAAALALACAAAVTTKFTGVLAGPVVALVLAIRALSSVPWPALGRTLSTRLHRFTAAIALCTTCALVTYVAIWAVYAFRFDASPDPSVHLDVQQVVGESIKSFARKRVLADHRTRIEQADVDAWRPDTLLRAAVFAHDHHLLPESLSYGLMFADAGRFRSAFLLGDVYGGARWYYFPVAFATKTPLTTLAVVIATPFLLLLTRRRSHAADLTPVLVPLAFMILLALTADLNIGLRHIFPLYPYLYVLAGLAAARAYALRPRLVTPLLIVLTLCLAAETLSAYPDYIPFFNRAAGGPRGGLRILSDSNLDWGQDLPSLARWQRAHPDRPLHLAYFGTADPAHYGIRYANAPEGYPYALDHPAATTMPTTGVLAVSASFLQGTQSVDPARHPYTPFLRRQPLAVLGGSIYLFDLDRPQ